MGTIKGWQTRRENRTKELAAAEARGAAAERERAAAELAEAELSADRLRGDLAEVETNLHHLLRECFILLKNCSHAEDQMARAAVLYDLRRELGLPAQGNPAASVEEGEREAAQYRVVPLPEPVSAAEAVLRNIDASMEERVEAITRIFRS